MQSQYLLSATLVQRQLVSGAKIDDGCTVFVKNTSKTQAISCVFDACAAYSTTITVLLGSLSPVLFTAMMRYSSSTPRGCSTRVDSVTTAVAVLVAAWAAISAFLDLRATPEIPKSQPQSMNL